MYDPHDGPRPHAGGAVATCHFCRDYADDHVRRVIGAPPRRWYVSVIYGRKRVLASGPYDTALAACTAVDPIRDRIAIDYRTDPRVAFAGYGIASTADVPDLPTVYGPPVALAA